MIAEAEIDGYVPATAAELAERKKRSEPAYRLYVFKKNMEKLALLTNIPNLAVGFYAGYTYAAGSPITPGALAGLAGTVAVTSTAQGIEKAVEEHLIKGKEGIFARFKEAALVSVPFGTVTLGIGYVAGAFTQKTLNLFS
jgi:hypothetical protein